MPEHLPMIAIVRNKKQKMNRLLAACIAMLLGACGADSNPPLPKLTLDPERVAVVGISSGAIMAQQMHLAFSDHLRGAALLSGPPYQCAEGSLERALGYCLKAAGAASDKEKLAAEITARAQRGDLAPLHGLRGDHVLVTHGKNDTLVPESMSRASLALYQALPEASSMTLRFDGDGAFAHLWPTTSAGGDCQTTATPYIGNCNRDYAGEVMQAMFGDAPAAAPAQAGGRLSAFDQDAYRPDGEDALLDSAGLLYQPARCAQGERCGLLIAFHGCEQNRAALGETFARDNGLNRWADVYGTVVLYPQTRSSYLPLNPKACWDWWGYSGANYDTRSGVQLRAVANMAAALGAPLQ